MPAELQSSCSDSRPSDPDPSGTERSVAIADRCARRGWPVHPLAPGGRPSPADDVDTLRVRTPSGGLHVWYRPGTTTKHGTYRPLGDTRAPAPLPLRLAQELQRAGHLPAPRILAPRPVPPRAQQAVHAAGGGRSRIQRTLALVLAPVEACGQEREGAGFSDALNRAAFTLGGLVAAGRLPREQAEGAPHETATASRPGQERRIEHIIRRGFEAGLSKPLYGNGKRA